MKIDRYSPKSAMNLIALIVMFWAVSCGNAHEITKGSRLAPQNDILIENPVGYMPVVKKASKDTIQVNTPVVAVPKQDLKDVSDAVESNGNKLKDIVAAVKIAKRNDSLVNITISRLTFELANKDKTISSLFMVIGSKDVVIKDMGEQVAYEKRKNVIQETTNTNLVNSIRWFQIVSGFMLIATAIAFYYAGNRSRSIKIV